MFWLSFVILIYDAFKIGDQIFDFPESVRRDTIMKVTNKMQLYRLIYYS